MGKSYFILKQSLAQAALRAPPEAALQCVVGHCYYHISVFLSFFLSFPGLALAFCRTSTLQVLRNFEVILDLGGHFIQ